MHRHLRIPRLVRLGAVAMLLATMLPGAAIAAQDPGSCGSNRANTYTAPVPAGLRAPGTHRVQWKAEFTDASTGERVVDDSIMNQITIDSSAPAYPNTVLIRLFRNSTILAGGQVITVDAMQPTQDARMYVNVSWLRTGKFYTGDFVISFRYETSRNTWSAYQATTEGPEQSFCVELTDAIWRKAYGWG